MRFISALDEQARKRLHQVRREGESARERHRAHALLLSDAGYTIDEIADVFFVDRDTAARWLARWEKSGFGGLADAPRSGRPRKLDPEQERQALEMVLAEPRQIKRGLAKIQDRFGKRLEKSFTLDWLRALLRRSGYRYRRCRASLRYGRDEQAFRKAQAELERLQREDAARQIDLYYLDEAGFSLTPTVPYAWQAPGERIEQKHTGKRKVNVLGLMRSRLERDEDFVPFVSESTVDSETLVACLDHFAARLAHEQPADGEQRRTVVVLDNAPTHTSTAFKRAEARWLRLAGIQLYFLPAYSPELNRIEHLWKHIKHYWLPLWASESFEKLTQALDEVLAGVGTTYRITFA